jgi:hypothetical protein
MSPTDAAHSGLAAGSARVDITPPLGTHLAGSGAGVHRPAQVVLDPLFASAVVFEASGRRVCLLSLDVTIVTQEWTDHIRNAAKEFGLEPGAVLVHATQTHSAPGLGHFMLDPYFPAMPGEVEYLRGGETAYYRQAAQGAVEAIRQAVQALRPVRMGLGRAVRDGLAFNRRGVRRDGRACMPWFYPREKWPLGPVHIAYLEGPADPEVGVLCARDGSGAAVAALLHFTCHPVNVYATQKLAVTPDWPGVWAAQVRAVLGGTCAPVALNGCCGNLNP